MTLHPLFTLLLDPTAGAAGLNLLSIMFWLCIALGVLCVAIERSFKQ